MGKIETAFVIAEVKTGEKGRVYVEAIIDDGKETKVSKFADKKSLIRSFADKGWPLSSDKTIRQRLSFLSQRKKSAIETVEEFREPIVMELIFQRK